MEGHENLIGLGSNDNSPLQKLAIEKYDGDMDKLIEGINVFFASVSVPLDPISENNPLLQQQCEVPSEYNITVEVMEKRLSKVKHFKGGSPDGLPAWIFHDFSHIPVEHLASIANAAMRQGVHPNMWKLSNTVPVPKVNPPPPLKKTPNIQSDLRPISLIPIASKVLEYFPCEWIYECIKDKVDPNQFGEIKGSSTTLALIHFVNYIAKETDKRNMYACVLLCDFSKTFDLVDHQLVL